MHALENEITTVHANTNNLQEILGAVIPVIHCIRFSRLLHFDLCILYRMRWFS
jgi:hypothetical protein